MSSYTWPNAQYIGQLNAISSSCRDVDDTDAQYNVIGEWKQQPPRRDARVYHTVLDTLHDPFVGGGLDLTQRQLSMCHIYMHTLAPVLLGTPINAPYSPAIAMTKVILAHSAVAAQLTSVLVDELICSMNGRAKTRDMIVRRSAANRAFKKVLANHHESFEAAYLGCIRLSQLAWLTHDMKTLRMVAMAAEMLTDSAGGLRQTILLTPNIEPIYLVCYPYARAQIRTSEAHQTILSRLLASLQLILRWKNQVVNGRVEEEIINPISPYILPASAASDTNMKSSFMLLVELCWMMIVLSQEPNMMEETLKYVALLRKSCPKPPSSDAERGRYTLTFSCLISHARREVLSRHDSRMRTKYDLFVTQMELDGMKIFDQSHRDGHITIIVKLYTWLTKPTAEDISLSDDDVENLREDIIRGWKQEYDWKK